MIWSAIEINIWNMYSEMIWEAYTGMNKGKLHWDDLNTNIWSIQGKVGQTEKSEQKQLEPNFLNF